MGRSKIYRHRNSTHGTCEGIDDRFMVLLGHSMQMDSTDDFRIAGFMPRINLGGAALAAQNDAIQEFKDRTDTIIAQAPKLSVLHFINDSRPAGVSFFKTYLLELLNQYDQLQEVSIEYRLVPSYRYRSQGFRSHTTRISFPRDKPLPRRDDRGVLLPYGVSQNGDLMRRYGNYQWVGSGGIIEHILKRNEDPS